jgi:hypothetical protein
MSRKDYIKIAELLRAYKQRLPRQEFDELVMDLAMLFKRDNERFSATKFGQYSYGEPKEEESEARSGTLPDRHAA